MGRIIGYQYDDNVQDGDAWIGSEDGGGRTKQYTAEAVANYLNIQGKISIVGQMTYKYGITPLSGPGTFAVFGGGTDPVAFSAITKLTLSNTDVSKQRVVEFLNLLVGSDILISKQSAISTFGYYSIDNYAVNATDPAYYDLGVTFKSGNGSMEAEQIYETQNFTLAAEENISTLQTTIDSGNTYQANPSNPLWTWGPGEISTTSTSFTSLLSSKRFKTTLIADGSYTDVLPNQLIFNNALGNETSITPNTALPSNIDLQWPSSSGILALTTDIISSPWDAVLGGINYAGGNVGIGTTSPSAKLEVNGGEIRTTRENVPANYLSLSTTSAGSFIKNAGGTSKGLTFDNVSATSPYINFKLLSSEAMRITSAGNVGVGTTSPSAPLDVATISSGPVAKFVNTSGTGGAGVVIQAGVATNSSILTLFDYQNNERLRVRGDGNVGIGTTSPSYILDIESSTSTTAGFKSTTNRSRILIEDDDTQNYVISEGSKMSLGSNSSLSAGNLTIDSSGNVGIGTTSPSAKLHVAGNILLDSTLDTGAIILSGSPAGQGGQVRYISGAATTNDFWFNVPTNGRYRFAVADSQKVEITAAGNVGIGTTSPSEKLDVAGNIELGDGGTGAALKYNSTNRGTIFVNGSEIMRLEAAGNVGIGTTSPTSKLDVAGGDIELDDVAAGIIMRSPDGTKYRITVANGGTLTVTAV